LFKRVLKEPLLHFAALSFMVFAVFHIVGGERDPQTQQITVTAAKIQQMTAVFAKTWQRSPTAPELKGLIDDYVREEIYVREALALGLDTDDTVIRRRLRQKMDFLNASAAESVAPGDDELRAYLKANGDKFRTEPMLAFQQVFLDPARHGDSIGEAAAAALKVLASSDASGAGAVGDPTLLPAELPLTRRQAVEQMFGPDFTAALDVARTGEWTGPVKSSYGIHLIKLTAREPGRVPTLDEARNAVIQEWTNDKRIEAERQRLEALLKRYDVKIEFPSASGSQP
jgi:hypothetical protein